jgi:hypothetical protein
VFASFLLISSKAFRGKKLGKIESVVLGLSVAIVSCNLCQKDQLPIPPSSWYYQLLLPAQDSLTAKQSPKIVENFLLNEEALKLFRFHMLERDPVQSIRLNQ